LSTQVTVRWHGASRFLGFGASGPPVLINFTDDETTWPSGQRTAAKTGAIGSTLGLSVAETSGPKPTDLLLMATGACTGVDIVSHLERQRVPFSGLDIIVTGERAADYPRFFTAVDVLYRLQASPDALPHLEQAAAISMERYCSVGLSLRAAKTWRCELE
jgi:putative redox protein